MRCLDVIPGSALTVHDAADACVLIVLTVETGVALMLGQSSVIFRDTVWAMDRNSDFEVIA